MDEGSFYRDLCSFFRSFSGLKGKTKVGQSIYNWGSRSPLHAKNSNFPEYLEAGEKHEVACAPRAGGFLSVHSQVSTATVCHIIFLSRISFSSDYSSTHQV